MEGAWYVLVRPLWWSVGALALAAGLLVLGARAVAAPGGVRDAVTALWRGAAPGRCAGWAAAGRAIALIVVGGLLLVDPRGVLTVAAALGGIALVAVGVEALIDQVLVWRSARRDRRAEASSRPAPAPGGARSRILVAGGLIVAFGLIVWAAWPAGGAGAGGDAAEQGAVAGQGKICNGHAELCERRFDEVAYAATHNSMSIAGAPGWFLAEQGRDIPGQLGFGRTGPAVRRVVRLPRRLGHPHVGPQL